MTAVLLAAELCGRASQPVEGTENGREEVKGAADLSYGRALRSLSLTASGEVTEV